jgi:glycosyltransferase involved in cell wall biosynthesis
MQATAYGSVARMRLTPSIVSIDCTQGIVVRAARSDAERRSFAANIRRDGEIFAAAQLIAPLSQWAADCLRDEYPGCTTEIAVMPNPVQTGAFDPSWAEWRYERAKAHGFTPTVLFVGGDFVRKGGFDLLDAWREGRFAGRASLHIVSDWPIEAHRLGDGVTVSRGITSHSPAWLNMWRDADIFALPTRDDAFGLVYQEAAAAGLPAIGPNLNAVPELIADGVTGVLTPRGSREALIAALDRLITSAVERRTMGARARARVETVADPAAYRDRLLDAVQRVARQERVQ